MAKKPSKGVKTRCGGTMTEAQYLAWIRSALRSKSLKWPPRAKALELARRTYKGPNKLQKWEYKCAICGEWFKAKEVIVDHHPKPAGSILSIADISEFVNNLYCEVENLRVLCVPDHKAHTYAESEGITFEEALLQKRVIEFMKKKADVLAFLKANGYTGASVSNEDKRRALVEKLFKEGKHGS